jgi:hypothetical protein
MACPHKTRAYPTKSFGLRRADVPSLLRGTAFMLPSAMGRHPSTSNKKMLLFKRTLRVGSHQIRRTRPSRRNEDDDDGVSMFSARCR